MSDPTKFDPRAIVMELIPAAVQVVSVAILLVLAKNDPYRTLVAAIICLMWLTLSKKKIVEDFGEFRLRRHLFSRIGEWMNRSDATDEFDDALSRYQMIEGSIEDEEYKSVVTAAAVANTVRGVASFLVQIYLVYVLATVSLGGELQSLLG